MLPATTTTLGIWSGAGIAAEIIKLGEGEERVKQGEQETRERGGGGGRAGRREGGLRRLTMFYMYVARKWTSVRQRSGIAYLVSSYYDAGFAQVTTTDGKKGKAAPLCGASYSLLLFLSPPPVTGKEKCESEVVEDEW